MTSNPGSPNPQPPKENIVTKLTGGLSWWIGSLTGKPQARKLSPSQKAQVASAPPVPTAPQQVSTNAATPPPPASSQPVTGDSVSQDLEKLRGLVKKVTGDVSKTVAPVVSKGVSASSQKVGKFGASHNKFIRTVLKIFFILLFLVVLIFIVMKLFQGMPQQGENGEEEGEEETEITNTPTPFAFDPSKPSVYVGDPEVLKLEEDIDVLIREISGTTLKETRLSPPLLDYNITFK